MDQPGRPEVTSRVVALALLVGTAAAAARAAYLWPRMTHWGATDTEARAPMAGDDLVGNARYRSTHAVSIDAPPDDVWPWLVQLGQGRGGLYSYDWLENLLGLDIHSVDRIEPGLQDLAVGDVVRLVPEGSQPPLRFLVSRLEAPTLLLLGPDQSREQAYAAQLPYPFWTFQVVPEGSSGSRLIVRFQMDFAPTLVGRLAYRHLLRPVHFVMERRMLLGIKQRTECSVAVSPHLSVHPA